ncbi:Putative calcium-binding protein (fragment) [Hyella patelloides LEGE 07179]|uniref:Calcium-binding protein n=1 Tax=Hyella patelloides LEGE 07179 TaxID=945734 RepID=A0A563VJ78_9CYAN
MALTQPIKALLQANQLRWNSDQIDEETRVPTTGGTIGSGVDLSYQFISSRPSGLSTEAFKNFTSFSFTQRNRIRTALNNFSDVANINFTEVNSNPTVTIGYAETYYDWNGDGEIENDERAGGLAQLPRNGGSRVVIDRSKVNFDIGSSGYRTTLHELGHAVGGFNDVTVGLNSSEDFTEAHENRNKGVDGAVLNSNQDSRKYTVMSYNNHPDMNANPSSLLLYDIAALQHLYGANMDTRRFSDRYTWSNNSAFIEAIWDAGGTDTIDASNQTRDTTINLNAGSFSSIGTNGWGGNAKDNLAIAYNVTIEYAYGGTGDDSITGNNAQNYLHGGDGNDTLVGGSGRDSLVGGDGNDRIRSDGDGGLYYGEAGNDLMFSGIGGETMDGGSGIDSIYHIDYDGDYTFNMASGETNFGSESFINFERVYMGDGDDEVTGNASNNRIYGGRGKDTLVGGTGRDSIFGGDDNDEIHSDGDRGFYYGDAGNDRMFAGFGSETMDGGSGADWIYHPTINWNYDFDMESGLTNATGESFTNFEHVVMGSDKNRVTGNASANIIHGNEGDDTLIGGAGRDSLYGGDDNDEIHSDGDGGFYSGGAGNDVMFSGIGGETMNGGSGIDTIDHTTYNDDYTFNMANGETNFGSESFINFENTVMGDGNDKVTGTNRSNIINTGGGNDVLRGYTSYNDIEIDWLTGGVGEDRYIVGDLHGNAYTNAGNSDYALITGFEEGDVITLDLRDSYDNHDYRFGSSPIGNVSGTGIFDETGDLLALVAGVNSSDLTLSPQSYTVSVKYA